MEVFGLNRLLFALLSICHPPKGSSAPVRYFYWFYTIFFGCVHVFGFSCGIRFGLHSGTDDVEGTLYAIFQIAGSINAGYTTFAGIYFRSDFTRTLDRYVELHKKEPELGLPTYLDKANRTCQKITRYFVIYVIWTYIIAFMLVVLIVTHCLLTDGYIDEKYFFTPFKFRLPWNQKCVAGWLAEQAFSAFYAGAYLFVVSAFVTFFMGISMHHSALTSFIQSLQVKIDEELQAEHINRNAVKHLLRRSIDTYNLAKEFFQETKTLFSRFYFIQLICSMVHLSCSIFQVDMVMQHPDMNLYMIGVSTTGSGSVLFLNCYFGERATNCYLDMAEHYYMLTRWYELPIDLQKYYILMIESAQRSNYYDGLGIAYLNIPTFGRMIRAVISYYLTFRTFAA